MRPGWIGGVVLLVSGVASAQQAVDGSLAIPMPGVDGRIILSRDILIRSGATSLGEALAGQVAGLHLMFESSATGALPSAVLRTPYSLSGQGAPLVLVDDIPVDVTLGRFRVFGLTTFTWWQVLTDMPLAEVESVAILKGLDATARYGPRAFSGAIAITSRRPQAQGTWFGASLRSGMVMRASDIETRRFTRDEVMAAPGAPGGLTPEERGAAWDACKGYCDNHKELFGGIRSLQHADVAGGWRDDATSLQGTITARRTGLAVRGTSDAYTAGRASFRKSWRGGTLEASHLIARNEGDRSWENTDQRTGASLLQRWPSWYDMENAPQSVRTENPLSLARNLEAPRILGQYFSTLHARSPALRIGGNDFRARFEGGLHRSTQRDTLELGGSSIAIESGSKTELYRVMIEHEVAVKGSRVRSMLTREMSRKTLDGRERSSFGGGMGGANLSWQTRDSLDSWWLASSWSDQRNLRRLSSVLRQDKRLGSRKFGWQVGAFMQRRDSAGPGARLSAGDLSSQTDPNGFDFFNVDPRRWERRRELEAEVSLGLRGRGRMYVTLFRSVTSNTFVSSTWVPGGTNRVTVSRLRAQGAEAGANVVLHASTNASLESGLSVAHARTTMMDSVLYGRSFIPGVFGISRPGRSITSFAARDTVDIFKSKVVGDAWPAITLTQRNDARWRGWRLTTALDAQLGVDMPNLDAFLSDRFGTSPLPDGGVSRRDAAEKRYEPVYVQDAAFVRLREVVASMPLRTHSAGRELRFDITLRNAFTWSRFDNLDPTVRNPVAVTNGAFAPIAGVPIMRSLSVALMYGI